MTSCDVIDEHDVISRQISVIQGDEKKTCQLVIFQRNNTAKFTKICIKPNLRMASSNLESYFNYFYTKCPKIAIKIIKKWKKNRFIRFSSFSVWVKLILCMKNVSKQLQCVGKCLFKEDLAILNINLFWLFIENQKIKIFRFS